MSAVNYEDLYEEFILLTSSSSSSSPSAGDHSSSPTQQTQLQESSYEQMPDSANPTDQKLLQSQPQRMSVISTAGFPTSPNDHSAESIVMNLQGETAPEDQIDSHYTVLQKEHPGNADELRKLLCAPTLPTSRGHLLRSPFINQQYQFPPQHFLSCSQISPTPSANIAWGHSHVHGHTHSQQMSHSPPQINYFNQQQYINSHHQQQHQQHLQQQMVVHQPSQPNNQQMNHQYQQQQQQMMNSINMRSNHWDNQPFPGGLNELWRSVPPECQRYLTPQDVPESARFRGYFTVCELLVLKRNLLGRCTGAAEESTNDDEAEKGSMGGTPVSSATNNNNNKNNSSKKRKRLPETADEEHPIEEDELEANCEVTVTVGVAVKEALDALDEEQQSNAHSNAGPSSSVNNNVPVQEHINQLPSISAITVPSQSLTTAQIITQTSSGHSQGQGQGSTSSSQKPIGQPPPYRTAQLVFKLLQIGNYQLRSFADLTPNKFKVLYNTQRIVYECQLPIVLPQREDMQPLRKLLTIDVGFDQITCVRFGNDKMFLRVEGAPLLTVTYNAITDDETSSPVSFQEQQLLDQIDQGQLKLSPCHQVFFINERLVHMLESQFRDHPRLRHLLTQNPIFNDTQQVSTISSNAWSK